MAHARRDVLAVVASGAVAGLAGCLGDDDDTPTPADAAVVTLEASAFDPAWVAVEVGATVTFEHAAGEHTVTLYHEDNDVVHRSPADATAFDEALSADSLEVDVDVEGVHTVFCRPHEDAGMVVLVVVGEPEEDDPALEAAPEELPAGMQSAIDSIVDDIRDAYGFEALDGPDDDDDDDDGGGPGY